MFLWLFTSATSLRFPFTPSCSTDDLQRRLSSSSDEAVVLLDTRGRAEYDVSRLPAARHLNFQASDEDVEAALIEASSSSSPSSSPSSVHVVCYCSVGYRSSILTQRINQIVNRKPDLFPKVKAYNLTGSLFKWAEEDRPLVGAAGRPTRLVHPFNDFFGRAVNPSRISYEPSESTKAWSDDDTL